MLIEVCPAQKSTSNSKNQTVDGIFLNFWEEKVFCVVTVAVQ